MSDLTDDLWERFGSLRFSDLPDDVVATAGHAVLDWFGCAIAGSQEPLASILREEFTDDDGPCTIVGSERRAGVLRAALVNGATGHALDFDDTSPTMGAHASVPLLPAVLAVAEEQGRSGQDVLTAYVVGMEVQSLIGGSIGAEHYMKGWHTTSTIGVFGAAAAASWLLGLDSDGFGTAMGIAASNSSGVKANFGTMTKPLHPGQAAERGVMAARLAARGYTANADAIDGNQSFAQAAGSGQLDGSKLDRLAGRWSTPRTLFKFHAACHLTHAGIEATRSILASGVSSSEIQHIELTVNPSILDVCGIPSPSTGLEAKFSLTGTQALLVAGVDTAAIETFNDGPINRADVQAFIPRVTVQTDTSLITMATKVAVRTASETHRAEADVSQPNSDLSAQGLSLLTKFEALATPVLGAETAASLGDILVHLGSVDNISSVVAQTARPGSSPIAAANQA